MRTGQHFRQVSRTLSQIACENLIIGGDLNFVIDFQRDSNYSRQNNPAARKAFVQILEEEALTDIWQKMNPGKRAFTWTKLNPYKYGRLDMIFVSDHLVDSVSSSSIIPGYRSDHSIVTLQMRMLYCLSRHGRAPTLPPPAPSHTARASADPFRPPTPQRPASASESRRSSVPVRSMAEAGGQVARASSHHMIP